MLCTVKAAAVRPDLKAPWDDPVWRKADTLEISHYRPEGSGHRPETFCRLLYDREGIAGIFLVRDRYVRSVHTAPQSPVWEDSCVEFFLQPSDKGYFNFEFNCGGAIRAGYIRDPERTPEGFRDFFLLPEIDIREILVAPSLPSVIDPEVTGPLTWTLAFSVPFRIIRDHAGVTEPGHGDVWRGNFYKCGDRTSHPHWGSWTALDERNFHLPRCFGSLAFA